MATQQTPIQRLRLGRALLEELVETVDRTDAGYAGRRDALRRPVNRPAVLIQGAPGEVASRHEVYIRNVSTSGASVLHTVILHAQLECTLVIISGERKPISVPASVVRCNHISGHMHDVGLRFMRTLTEDEAVKLCISPESPAVITDTPEQHLLTALARYKELAHQVHELIEAGAPAEQVLPLLDELRSLEPVTAKAA